MAGTYYGKNGKPVFNKEQKDIIIWNIQEEILKYHDKNPCISNPIDTTVVEDNFDKGWTIDMLDSLAVYGASYFIKQPLSIVIDTVWTQVNEYDYKNPDGSISWVVQYNYYIDTLYDLTPEQIEVLK